MYKQIMVPVDLAHADKLGKALEVSADLAKHFGARMCYVGVTAPQPSSVAHNEAEFAEKLEEFASQQAAKHGVSIDAKVGHSHDPAIDLDDVLARVGGELNADLVVMASHVPTFADHLFGSNAGGLASQTAASVLIVR